MGLFRFLYILVAVFGCLSPACVQAQSLSLSISQRIRAADQAYLGSFVHQNRRTAAARFLFLERQGKGIDTLSRMSVLSYSERVSARQTVFGSVSALNGSLDDGGLTSDSRGISGALGSMYYMGAGLTLGGSVFATRNLSVMQVTPTSQRHVSSVGFGGIAILSQLLPVSPVLFLRGSASLSPVYNKAHVVNAKDESDLSVRLNTNMDLYYRVTPKITLQGGAGFSISNQGITVSGDNALFHGTLGGRYRFDRDISAQFRYQREEGEGIAATV